MIWIYLLFCGDKRNITANEFQEFMYSLKGRTFYLKALIKSVNKIDMSQMNSQIPIQEYSPDNFKKELK